MMKIDFHVHVTPPDITANWEKYAKKEPHFSLLSKSKVNKFADVQDVIAMMEQNNIDKSVIFGFAFRDMGLCRYVNDYVIDNVKKYPQKLEGFAVVPKGGKKSEIERCHDAGLKGVGELFDISDKTANFCRERGIPLLLHASEPVGRYYPGKTDVTLKQLETFINKNGDLKIILAHWGGGIMFYETIKEIKDNFQNVYYDTSASPFIYDNRIYRIVKALNLCKKVIFGSDFPILQPSRYFSSLEKCGFSDEEKDLILGGNALELLGTVK
ncbi:MAG: amidohydrolase family protein [Treponema sp.]|nr:amidohydrolase family protein [Treponema sp.]